MRPIRASLRKRIDQDPWFKKCVRAQEGTCSGRITIEHAHTYAGRQIDEYWNFIPLCWYHHLGDGFKKSIGQKIAMQRANPDDVKKYPRLNWNDEQIVG